MGHRPYYRDNLLAKTLLPDIVRKSQCWVSSFNRTVHWRIEHAAPSLSWSERCLTSFLQHCSPNSPDLNPDYYSIWNVGFMQEKVYRSRIANVNELEMRLNDERRRFNQSIVDAAIAAMQWRLRLSVCVRGAGHTLSTKQKVSAILSCICQKLLN